MPFKSEFVAMASEIYLFSIIHCLILYGVICTTSGYLNYPIIVNNLSWLTLQVLFFSVILTIYNPLSKTLCFNNFLILDNFSSFVKTIVLLTTIITIIISIKYNQFEKINAFEYIILILLAIIGILLLISSFNLLSIYLSIEIQSFCLYILAALNRNSEFSAEAGLKYFVLGAFSSGLLLFGFSLIYGFTGTTDFGHIFQFLLITNKNNSVIGIITFASIFIFSALLFKLSAAPFHLWSPDIYEGSPTSITAFFAIVPKIGVLALLSRFSYVVFYDIFFSWQDLFILTSILSIIVGSFSALVQQKIKRLFAYSAISHMGYIIIGFSAGSFEGLQASYLYIIIYIIMTIGCFIMILAFYEKKKLIRLNYIKDLLILKRSNLTFCLLMIITIFSMAGIPPLAGFFSKMFLFIVAIQSKIYLVATIGVLSTIISCFYYLRIIKLTYFDSSYKWLTFIRLDREKSIIFAMTNLLLIFVGVYPTPFIYKIHNALFFIIKTC